MNPIENENKVPEQSAFKRAPLYLRLLWRNLSVSIYKRFTCSSSSRRIRTLWILLLVSTRNKPFKSQYLIWIPLSSCYKILVNHESRIWCLLKRTSLGWWKCFFSSGFCPVMYWYYQENLHGNHFWRSELFVITLCMAK